MRFYYSDDECTSCGSDDVITLHDDNGSYEHCNDCGHDERN
jgi:Zn ribbon nucleic-acid-binding protein